MRSRVLIDIRPLQGPSARRGIGTYVRGLLAGLVEARAESWVALMIDGGLPPPRVPAGDWQVERVDRRYRGRLAAYEDAVATAGDLARLRPAAYHSLALSLPGRSSCPVVLTLHDLIPWAWAWGGARMLGERFRYWPGRRLLARADLVVAVSRSTAADAERMARVDPKRILVIPEGVDPEFSPQARGENRWGITKPFILYVGALDARKDPGALLTAWRRARAAADVELVLAGDPGPQAPRALDGARLLGYVSTAELAELLSAAICLVFPSRYEGFGLPALEAMACGCPVVAYRNSSLPELVGEAGRLVPDGNQEALAEAVVELVLDPDLARCLGAAGVMRARQYTWKRSAEMTLMAYRRVLR